MHDSPDFVRLYRCELCPHQEETESAELLSRHVGLTPRMAFRLWWMATVLADRYLDAPEDLVDELPLVARPYCKAAWLERLRGCFTAVAERLATGEFDYQGLPSCTGEEMALHVVIDHARSALDDGWESANQIEQLPSVGQLDEDFEWARETLLKDIDVLMLFDLELDGFESDEQHQAHFAGVNLHPTEWFLPFDA